MAVEYCDTFTDAIRILWARSARVDSIGLPIVSPQGSPKAGQPASNRIVPLAGYGVADRSMWPHLAPHRAHTGSARAAREETCRGERLGGAIGTVASQTTGCSLSGKRKLRHVLAAISRWTSPPHSSAVTADESATKS